MPSKNKSQRVRGRADARICGTAGAPSDLTTTRSDGEMIWVRLNLWPSKVRTGSWDPRPSETHACRVITLRVCHSALDQSTEASRTPAALHSALKTGQLFTVTHIRPFTAVKSGFGKRTRPHTRMKPGRLPLQSSSRVPPSSYSFSSHYSHQ